MLRGIACEIIQRERIETTMPKAKEAKKLVERVITLAKRAVEKGVDSGVLSAKRKVFDRLQRKLAVEKVFDVLVERYRKRAGGYTRIIKTRTRAGDGAQLVIFELVRGEEKKAEDKSKGKTEGKSGEKSAKPKTVSKKKK